MGKLLTFGCPINTYRLSDEYKEFNSKQLFKIYKSLSKLRPNDGVKGFLELMEEAEILIKEIKIGLIWNNGFTLSERSYIWEMENHATIKDV